MYSTPILFLIFNRPDTTGKVFERIRAIKPKQLFIAADGPRKGNGQDILYCKAAREIVAHVDWECELFTLFREENLGCRKAVSEAISWFFDHVEEGVILEDDTLPDLSFFPFCRELLERYRDDPGIMMISGNNFLSNKIKVNYSYYFSNYHHVWGWATWRRAWEKFDEDLKGLSSFKEKEFIFLDQKEKHYWEEVFNQVKTEKIDSWGYVWFLSIWNCSGVSINPAKNLVKNIGFGPDATHTKFENKNYIKEAGSLKILTHPLKVEVNKKADDYTKNHLLFARPSNYEKVKCLIGKLLKDHIPQHMKNIIGKTGTFLGK